MMTKKTQPKARLPDDLFLLFLAIGPAQADAFDADTDTDTAQEGSAHEA